MRTAKRKVTRLVATPLLPSVDARPLVLEDGDGRSNGDGRETYSQSNGHVSRGDTKQLRRALQEQTEHLNGLAAELAASKHRQEWIESDLKAQRHARQVLEAALSATYTDTIARIRDVVRASVPHNATLLVVSRGDEELLKHDGRRGWHFPRSESGEYAGYNPVDSAEAIEHLESLIAKGGEYLLFPNTAFWWLEHYRDLEEHLDRTHLRIWRDDRCAIYKLRPDHVAKPEVSGRQERHWHAGSPQARKPQSASAERYNVVCFPIINWDFRFQRPQQLMRQFAVAGHRVFYLSHEFGTNGEPYTLRPLGKNLYEIALRGARFKVRQGLLDETTLRALSSSLNTFQRDCLAGATVAIIQSPFWWPVVKEAASAHGWPVVYDCMDYQAGFTTSHPLILEQDRELLVRANLVVASSTQLEAEARKHNSNVLLLRNACEYEHFAKVRPKSRSHRPVIGYYGAISEWFDADLIADLAQRRPDWDFILVGDTLGADLRRLRKLANVSLPGEKPYAEIPDWLARFDVAILPFKRTPLTEATNPVKAYEILASGRSLVSVPLPEMVALQPLVRLASSPAEFEREIETEFQSSPSDLQSERRAFARQNTWQRRLEHVSTAIRNLFGEQREGQSRRTRHPLRQHANRPRV